LIAGAGLLFSGCATKKHVRNTTAPIQAKVDQVGEQANRNSESIEETRSQSKAVDDRAQNGINPAQERASTADQDALTANHHASDAMNRGNEASRAADQNRQGLDQLRGVISQIDDHKLQTSLTVPFRSAQYSLSNTAKANLDNLASEVKSDKRFFIAVEGYTDKVGSASYNENLSRRRADRVVEYLVAKDEIPVYRIHMVGLGDRNPVAAGRNRVANARDRRVEVKVFNADQATSVLSITADGAARRP
jgi:OmpA-OmpF porin, OOP family